jgi:hypothetical protein
MTRFKSIDVKDLVKGKKYLIIQQLNSEYSNFKNDNNSLSFIEAFQGKFKNIHKINKLVYFDKLSSVISGKPINCSRNAVMNNALFYEYIKRKDSLQLSMEERSLKDIMRNILGDESFVHYLFEDCCKLEIKYEKIQESNEEPVKESRKPDFTELDFVYESSPIELSITNNIQQHNIETNNLQTNTFQINDFYINDLEPNNLQRPDLETNDFDINTIEIHNLD